MDVMFGLSWWDWAKIAGATFGVVVFLGAMAMGAEAIFRDEEE